MKLITRDTDYAVRALCVMAISGKEVISVQELVKETKIPRAFLRRILQILNARHIIQSYKGKGGGFRLHTPPNKISLIDLIEIFQGDVRIIEHVFKRQKCPRMRGCNLKAKIDKIERELVFQLKKITIGSLIS